MAGTPGSASLRARFAATARPALPAPPGSPEGGPVAQAQLRGCEVTRLVSGETGQRKSICAQDVGDDVRARSADVLRHADPRAGHLRLARFADELLEDFDDLVDARRADGVAARF